MLNMINRKLQLIDLPQQPLSPSDQEWGAFRVLDADGAIFDEFDLNELEATDLACWLGGSIQHWSPERGQWLNW